MNNAISIAFRLFVLLCFGWSSLGFSYAAHVCSKMGRVGILETCPMDHGGASRADEAAGDDTASCCSEEKDDAVPDAGAALLIGQAANPCCSTELSSLPAQDSFTPAQSALLLQSSVPAVPACPSIGTTLVFVPVRRTVCDSSPPGILDLPIANSVLNI